MKYLHRLGKGKRMPEPPRSQMIGKCTRCGTFRRVADISAGACVDTLVCKATVMEPCAHCDEWTDKKELELHDGICNECYVTRGAE